MRSLLTPIERVACSSLTVHPENPREGDVGGIAESLKTNGQFRPLVVQRSGSVVLAGNHTLLAARSIGWKEIDVTFLDVDDETALRILVADNRYAALGRDDPAQLATILADLAASEAGLPGTGFDGDDLDALIADNAEPLDFNARPVAERCGACGQIIRGKARD